MSAAYVANIGRAMIGLEANASKPVNTAEAGETGKPTTAKPVEPDLFPTVLHLWTRDSKAPDGEKIQHKEIHLKGWNSFTGTYQYREIASHV